jgi:hypothetical protein
MNRVFLVAMLSPLLTAAQSPVMPMLSHTVRAVGTATITAKPDQARISIGAMTQAATAEDAVEQDAAKTQSVLVSLKALIGSNGTIQTTNYSVAPQYKYEQGQAPTITGYEANHTVEVTLNEITLVGKVIDAASKAGANGINRIEFTVKDDSGLREEALSKAAAAARKNAEAIAKSLGLGITGIAAAETNEANPIRPIMAPMAKMMMAAPAATPVESGTIEVQASVTIYLSVN